MFFKGCPVSCAWCCNPETQDGRPELVWVGERCLGCDLCLSVCEKAALGGAADSGRTIDRER